MAYRYVLQHAIRNAAHILTPSQYMKGRVCTEHGRRERDVTVTPEGAMTGMHAKAELPHIVQKPYILVVGSAYPHKNLEALSRAFLNVRERYRKYSLVFVGRNDFFMRRFCEEHKGSVGMLFLGEVTDAVLTALYQNASCLAFPSLEEGFGLPGIEALQYGIPVLAGDRASLPEVYGEHAWYVNPYNVEEIARVLEEMLRNGKSVVHMPETEDAWKVLAKKTLEVYRKIAS